MEKVAYELTLKVRDYELDSEGIVNNARYLNYLEHTRHEFCHAAGFSFAQMQQLHMAPVVRRAELTYHSPLTSGETFSSKLSLCRKGPRFIFHQWIVAADGRKILDAFITVVNVINGSPSRGEEFARAFKDYICSEE